ncbi:MAG: 16S rRNA (guanine(527)-N(7))-methyltransferase RsmG [Chloroflexota bacterium]
MDRFFQHAENLLGIRLSNGQLAALEVYERELLAWNSRFNLTAIRDAESVRIKHFLDSLTCTLALREVPTERVIDVGTGAGFPGIPLKILCPHMKLTLIESIGKKANFCRHVIKLLKLDNVEVIQERIEVLGQSPVHRERYDWALARAVAVLPTLSEYLLPLVRVGGRALAMKGESGPAEAQSAERAMRILGGHLRQIVPVTLPGVAEDRYLIVVDKVAATPDTYPRRVGAAQKKPL